MLPRNHLLQLVPNRVNAAVQRLREAVWSEQIPLVVEATEAFPRQLTLEEAQALPREQVAELTWWGKLFDQRWCHIALPKSKGTVWLNWRDQGEATLYIDGKPFFGFDVAHRHCKLPPNTQEVWIESNCIQSAIWHPEANGMKAGSFFEGASLCQRNDEAWDAYHDLKCLFDLALDMRADVPNQPSGLSFGLLPPLDKCKPVFRQLLRWLDEAIDALDLKGISALRWKLGDAYRALRVDKTFMHCVLTGHAHIDLVWIWPERIGELKAVHVFATMDRLMEEYPEFKFAYSQPASYEAVKRRAPKLYDQVRKRIRSGQWEATGAMYVESDTIFACGEALAQSFVLGQKGFKEIHGKSSKLTWLPDVFGYSAALPQIMKQLGVEYFFTTKMTWNAINRFPHSSFIWRGNDGSEVVSHVTQNSGYVTHMEVKDLKGPMLGHQQADVHGEYLLPTGYGDGGGGPTHEMCERARRFGALPGLPTMSWDQPEAFFERLAKVRDNLPTHQGECYLEYHRGTFTTHGDLKEAFRGLERALQSVEAAAAVTGRKVATEHAWKRLVFAQFHDYIPGSSVWDVYLEGLPELRALTDECLEQAATTLDSKNGTPCLFNPHGVTVKRWVECADHAGEIYLEIPPFAGVAMLPAIEAPATVELREKTVSNGLVSFRMNASGWVDLLEWEGVEVPLSKPLGQLMVFPDFPANFEAWDIDRQALSIGSVCEAKATIKPIRLGEHRAGFAVTRKIGKTSEATVTFTLEAGSPLVHIGVELDWNEPGWLLKLLFPTAYAATQARFGIAYGSVLRPQVLNGPVSEAMWEVPFTRHLEVFDEGEREGLFLVTESKYGATVREGEIGLSLVRSARVTGLEGHAHAWPPHLTRLEVPSTHSDIGRHSIRLAIGRYDIGLSRERQPAVVAETLFTHAIAYHGEPKSSPFLGLKGGETLAPCWAKPGPRGSWILRLHETSGCRGKAEVLLQQGWKISQGNLGEESFAPAPDGVVRFTPYQVITLQIHT